MSEWPDIRKMQRLAEDGARQAFVWGVIVGALFVLFLAAVTAVLA